LYFAIRKKPVAAIIIEKETVDEVIFRTMKPRNRLMLELMARGGMRIGEVLKLTLSDIHDQKLTLRNPKSGKEYEYVFIPVKVSERLRDYAKTVCQKPGDRIFPISYEAARMIVQKAGKMAGIHLRPHGLRRHSATFASRSGVPIAIVSKIILCHSNLSTTENRVLFFNKKGRKSSVPLDWTDMGAMDPFVAVSAGRALFRVEDFLGLIRLIKEIKSVSRK
jgi:integrase